MFTLKKLLLLLFFLGVAFSSPCYRKREADEEGNDGEAKTEGIKRGIPWRPPHGLKPRPPTRKLFCGKDKS
uniref:Odorranain-M-PR n=2 Tax=Neobatrachia TaxID=8416 RepID=J9RMX5_PSERG|nr:odorranain-M-Pb precursor [Lithobates pipiens]AFR43674.1 odorranain-M-PR precursor [Pseudacris regilla]